MRGFVICSDNIKENGMGGTCSTHGRCEKISTKPEGKRPLVRFMCRWENNIKMCLKEMVCP
jgi:hypothetical protein